MRPNPANAFEYTTVPYGDDGRLVRGIIARCGNCDAAIPLPVNAQSGHAASDERIEWQFISRKLEMKGWQVGKNRHAHRCPKCIAVVRFDRKTEAKKEAPMKVVENVRTMTREDRRLIFDTLNKVYVDDTVGYGEGWTDEKVSIDLGVPRQWVKVIREENFGDEVSSVGIRNEIKDAKAALAQINELKPEIIRLLSLADKIEKSLADIQKVFK